MQNSLDLNWVVSSSLFCKVLPSPYTFFFLVFIFLFWSLTPPCFTSPSFSLVTFLFIVGLIYLVLQICEFSLLLLFHSLEYDNLCEPLELFKYGIF